MNQVDENLWSCLHLASYLGHSEIVELLLKDYRVDVNLGTDDGSTALYLACQEGNTEVVKLLSMNERVDVNKAMIYQIQPISVACMFDHVTAVKWLIASGRIMLNKGFERGVKNHTTKYIEEFSQNPELGIRKMRVELGVLGFFSFSFFFFFLFSFFFFFLFLFRL